MKTKKKKTTPMELDVVLEATNHRPPRYLVWSHSAHDRTFLGTLTAVDGRGYFKAAASRPFLTTLALGHIHAMLVQIEERGR